MVAFVNQVMFSSSSRVVEAAPHKAIVVPASGKDVKVKLRKQDLSMEEFLSGVRNLPR